MALTLGSSSIVGTILESVIYGIYALLFWVNVYLDIRNRRAQGSYKDRPNFVLVAASILLFLVTTAHWVVDVYRLYEAVITLQGVVPLDLYYANLADPAQITVTGLIAVGALVGDFILIYRLYHVCKPYWWVCIIPAGCWIGVLVSACILLYNMAHVTLVGPQAGVFLNRVEQWITSAFTLIFVTDTYCTTLIIFRLWSTQRKVEGRVGGSYIFRAMRIFIESAALQTTCFLVTFVTFKCGNLAQYGMLDFTAPIIGVSFTLIFLRLNWQKNSLSDKPTSSTTNRQPTYPLRSINVNVSQAVETDGYAARVSESKTPYEMA